MYSGPHRKNLRLKGFDYSQGGGYFVTICTKNREHYFGEICDGEMRLNEMGEFLQSIIENISNHFLHAFIDLYVIMPNHIHAIVMIYDDTGMMQVGNADLRSLRDTTGEDMIFGGDRTKMYLSKFIHGMKSSYTREIRKKFEDFEFAWQRSFYDVIIRDENHLQIIREYIENNPKNWEDDNENT